MPEATVGSPRQLADELTAVRSAFLAGLERATAGRGRDTRLSGDLGLRELVAHVGYWVGHAADAIHAVEQGRAGEFDAGEPDVAARDETVARVARQTDLATVRRREEGSYRALLERLHALDPALLEARLADGSTLRDRIREDGPVHYRDHAAELDART